VLLQRRHHLTSQTHGGFCYTAFLASVSLRVELSSLRSQQFAKPLAHYNRAPSFIDPRAEQQMNHRKSRQRLGKVGFGYQTLEARTLLATITGTEGPDVFRVNADEIWINDVLYSGPLDAENTIDGLGKTTCS